MLIDLEGHGREEGLGGAAGLADADLTRTVGWFTSLYPVWLDPGPLDLGEALSGGASLGRAVKAIKEQLRLSIRSMKAYLVDPAANVAALADFEKTEDLRICKWCNFRIVCRPELG